jgi:polyribonucleotide nucleotidyltransferase
VSLFEVVESAFEIDGRRVTLETGRIARQAHGAVLVRQGRAAVLVTAVMGEDDERDDGFVPLTVEYREKLAAAGRIPGSFQRRETRIGDDEILASRILDRSTRPLFAKGFGREVQVQATVLSADFPRVEAPWLALIGASAALHLSSIPWDGPIAGARLVRCDGAWIALPDPSQRARADVDLVVAIRKQGLVMVEGGANQVPEPEVLEGLLLADSKFATLLAAIEALRAKAGRPKVVPAPRVDSPPRAAARAHVEANGPAALAPLFEQAGKHARRTVLERASEALVRGATAAAAAAGEASGGEALAPFAAQLVHALADRLVRERVLAQGKRLDGRGPEEIRPIECSVDWLAGPHGSALFTRGETQAMVSCTLAAKDSAQEVETLGGLEPRTFLLHYNFPPYSVGEVKPLRGPGRREIGHGNLARRALVPVLPPFAGFPYVIRVESDISESNGSSSMATTCGGCLALMDAGVPISAPVAGIAMGLVSDGARFQVLSDILGDEDHLGDMDFKVAGTAAGVTAVQMDNKMGSLPREVLGRALEQAARGRRHILEAMAKTLAAPRAQTKEHAPRVTAVRIATPAISDVIGPRGAHLKALRQSLGVEVTIDDAGYAFVYASGAAAAREAARRIRAKAGVVRSGRLYRGRVSGVKEFGAFVRIFDSAEGLVHVSEWDAQFTSNLAAVAREGDEVVVRVLGVDERGKLRLSRKDAQGAKGEEVVE